MLAAALAATSALTLAGCDEQGPLERAGEEVDEAVEDIGNGGETLGNSIDDAVDDVREGAEDAADEVRDAVN
jgi:predicted small lipoprotein YifL